MTSVTLAVNSHWCFAVSWWCMVCWWRSWTCVCVGEGDLLILTKTEQKNQTLHYTSISAQRRSEHLNLWTWATPRFLSTHDFCTTDRPFVLTSDRCWSAAQLRLGTKRWWWWLFSGGSSVGNAPNSAMNTLPWWRMEMHRRVFVCSGCVDQINEYMDECGSQRGHGMPLSLLPLFQCGDGSALREARPAGFRGTTQKGRKKYFLYFSLLVILFKIYCKLFFKSTSQSP